MDEKTLEELAVVELLKEAKRGRERSATMGPKGWQKELVPSTNKQFLNRTLSSVLHSQKTAKLKRMKYSREVEKDSSTNKRQRHESEDGPNNKQPESSRGYSSKQSPEKCMEEKPANSQKRKFRDVFEKSSKHHGQKKTKQRKLSNERGFGMIRDRLPDLLRLSRRNPSKYYEPEHHEEVPMPLEMTMVLSRAEKVQKFLLEMDKMLQELQLYYGGMIASSTSQPEQRKQVASTMNRFTALTRKTRSILQRMDLTEQETIKYYQPEATTATVRWSQSEPNVQVSWKRPSLTTLLSLSLPAEIRIKLTLHGVLSFRLAELVKEYYTVQKKHNEMTRIKVQRQMSIIGRSFDQHELDRAVDEGETVPLLHGNIVDDQQISKEMRAQLKEVEHFEKEILALEKNISQLHDAFITMSTIVQEQGAIVDRIEHHLTISSDYVESSKQQLKKATKLQHKYRKKRCCIFIVVLVLIVIIAAIIALSVKKPGAVRQPKTVATPSVAHPRLRRSDWSLLGS